ncbi:MAG: hypothetical protein NUV44_10890 [Candidatus Scalindua sp.]|nr:hypothetical protein [Candidatus Scalindua sp.]
MEKIKEWIYKHNRKPSIERYGITSEEQEELLLLVEQIQKKCIDEKEHNFKFEVAEYEYKNDFSTTGVISALPVVYAVCSKCGLARITKMEYEK